MRRSPLPRVALWGPFPHEGGVFGGGIGGYARCNSQMLKTFLAREADVMPVRMSVPWFGNRILHALSLLPRMIADMAVIARVLLVSRPDVLHITALYYKSIYREAFAVWLAGITGTRSYYDIRAGKFEDFWRTAPPLERACLRFIMRRADDIAVEGMRYGPFVEATFGRHTRWVPNFFLAEDLERFQPAPLERPREGEPFRLGFVGYLIPDKGIDVLLEAAWRLGRETPVEVTLVGHESPQFRRPLEAFRERQDDGFRLQTPGRLELDELLERMRRQHVFVFLSRFHGEGHSNAVTEAMALGLPVVSSAHGFLADVVTADTGVVVHDPTDVERVVAVLRALRNDWPRLQAMGRAGRRRIETCFSDRALEPTMEVYRAGRPGLRAAARTD